MFLSLLYVPQVNGMIRGHLGFSIPSFVKVCLGIILVWFTLGISDLGDMYF